MELRGLLSRAAKRFRAEDVQDSWSTAVQAAALQPPPLPKAPKGASTVPGYRTQVATKTTAIQKPSLQTTTMDRVASLRTQNSEYAAMRFIGRNSPEVSSAISMMLRTAITQNYVVIGRDLEGQINPEATAMAQELLRRMTFLGSSDASFGAQQGLQSLSETLAMDLMNTGALGLEVALDKQRVPASFNPVAVSTLVFYEEDNAFRIVQKVGGEEIDLDIPTFIYVALDQVTTEAYPTSPLASVMQPVLADLDFNNDVRKALKRAVLPRLVAELDSEMLMKATPPDILGDPEKLAVYRNSLLSEVEGVVNSLNPEDALVGFDYVTYSYVDGGFDPSQIIERVQKVLNAKLVAGARTMPVTLGFSSTSAAGSAESLLFLKQCDGIRRKLNEAYSRALTVAVRLMGQDCYVEFEYDTPNLRPEDELEAFRAMKQSRILEQLSLGLITDEEASVRLTGHLPPPGAPKLSGTMFKVGGNGVSENPTSNTANGTEKTLAPETPTQKKS